MKRAIRRHHYQRLKKYRQKRFKAWGLVPDNSPGIYAATACVCSCAMCGNPRKYFKLLTKQEYLSKIKYIEGCSESNIYCPLNFNNIGRVV